MSEIEQQKRDQTISEVIMRYRLNYRLGIGVHVTSEMFEEIAAYKPEEAALAALIRASSNRHGLEGDIFLDKPYLNAIFNFASRNYNPHDETPNLSSRNYSPHAATFNHMWELMKVEALKLSPKKLFLARWGIANRYGINPWSFFALIKDIGYGEVGCFADPETLIRLLGNNEIVENLEEHYPKFVLTYIQKGLDNGTLSESIEQALSMIPENYDL